MSLFTLADAARNGRNVRFFDFFHGRVRSETCAASRLLCRLSAEQPGLFSLDRGNGKAR
jgi:hypothetical protein